MIIIMIGGCVWRERKKNIGDDELKEWKSKKEFFRHPNKKVSQRTFSIFFEIHLLITSPIADSLVERGESY
jgi:hypothetical protein